MAKVVQGTDGNDVLSGDPGDTLVGGQGSDTYIIYDPTTVIAENALPNTFDLLYTFVSYVSRNASLEYISTAVHSGTDPINLIGSGVGQEIIGNYGDNVLDGQGGGDRLYGLAGNDTYIASAGDTIIEQPGDGYDTLFARNSFVLSEGVSIEFLSLERAGARNASLTGNAFVQTLVGNEDANILDGGGAADTLVGLEGDDVYRVYGMGEVVVEAVGSGNDTIYTSGNFYLTAGTSIETISAANQGESSELYLLGNELSQQLIGDYGNNTLNGGGGSDTLTGLLGDDTYRIYSQNDAVVEQADQGDDIVYTSGNYRLAAGVSVETLSTHSHISTLAMNLTGNELNNTVIGNYGVNILDGGGGQDTLIGLEGADVFRFTTAPTQGGLVRIADYGTGDDVILLDSQVFTALADGVLPSTAFAYGTQAGDSDDRIVYDPASGILSYDADGSGSEAAVQFAQLATGIAQNDFRIVAATVPQELLTISNPGTFLVGGAIGEGTQIPPSVSSVTFEFFGPGYYQNLIFGPGTTQGALPFIKFENGNTPGTFDFSQLTQAVVAVPGQGYAIASGQIIVPDNPLASSASTLFPTTLIGTAYDDVFGGYIVGTVRGGAGNDVIRDAAVMDGGEGDDYLAGSINLKMTGGPGADTFELPIRTQTPGTLFGSSPNIITDFDPSEDRITLVLNYTRNGSVDLDPGALSAAEFDSGTAPVNDDVRIFYNVDTGELSFLINGNGPTPSGEIPVFAKLQPGLELTADNFTIIVP
ncbi:hypothetical protein [Qipengyuania sp. MTN3-11]|uniref:hypothetical protein n=1 Tax=Qipengyuania sp. MTN3-11 TaxID=3056557 RepID=UPI0036F1B144